MITKIKSKTKPNIPP